MKKIRIEWTYEYVPEIKNYSGAKTIEDCAKIDDEVLDIVDLINSGFGSTLFQVVDE